ncbi:hypothetical protein [Thermodesulfovibrio sp. 3462-1]|uniref:Uncharacterized protein n=1 Tax=Thermodesulfovibrio obliviosus TaxID=3118332 RepID=A0AAU8H2S3_9BACT
MGEIAKRVVEKLGLSYDKRLVREETVKEEIDSAVLREQVDKLIEETLERINKKYTPGLIEWAKKNEPDIWKKILEIEERINFFFKPNVSFTQKSFKELKDILGEYESLYLLLCGYREQAEQTVTSTNDKLDEDIYLWEANNKLKPKEPKTLKHSLEVFNEVVNAETKQEDKQKTRIPQPTAQHKEGINLNRPCVICGSDSWIILKPNQRHSAIECLNCGHIELHIFNKGGQYDL